MKRLLLAIGLSLLSPQIFMTAAQAQTVTFLCAAPAGHVCQFAVRTAGAPVNFSLPRASVERRLASLRTPTNIASAILVQ